MNTTWRGRWPRPPLTETTSPVPGLARRAFFGASEPWLEDLLNVPVTRAVMARDGVDMADLRGLIAATRARLAETGA